MISYTKGNLLDADVEAVVNTVNTVGVMGKGIALMFKEAFPENYKEYKDACKRGGVEVGYMFVTETKICLGQNGLSTFLPKYIGGNRQKLSGSSRGSTISKE